MAELSFGHYQMSGYTLSNCLHFLSIILLLKRQLFFLLLYS